MCLCTQREYIYICRCSAGAREANALEGADMRADGKHKRVGGATPKILHVLSPPRIYMYTCALSLALLAVIDRSRSRSRLVFPALPHINKTRSRAAERTKRHANVPPACMHISITQALTRVEQSKTIKETYAIDAAGNAEAAAGQWTALGRRLGSACCCC